MSNTAFNQSPNGMCNNTMFSAGTIWFMHQTTTRMYQVTQAMAGIKDPSPLAFAINESPQVVTNWARRGVSERGALKVQKEFGCDANWILTGEGGILAGWPFSADLLKAVRDQAIQDKGFLLEVENSLRTRLRLTPLGELTPATMLPSKQNVATLPHRLQPSNDEKVTSGYPDPKKGSAGRARLNDVKTPKPTGKKGHASTKHQRAARPKGGGRA